MKVLLDARKLGDGGIGVHIENLVDSLLALPEASGDGLDLSLLVRPEHLEAVRLECMGRWKGRLDFHPESSGKYSFSEYFLLPLRNRQLIEAHDIYHSPHYTLPYFISIPKVVTIHDLIHVNQPENFYHAPVARFLISSAARRADHMVLVSNSSRKSFRRALGFLGARKTVVHNAVRIGLEEEAPACEVEKFRKEKALRENYFLFVGSDRPHKGFKELLLAWADVSRELGERMPVLAAVGSRFSKETKELVSKLGLSRLVHFLGELSQNEMASCYKASKAVVVPSREEGFGLVALEAMQSKKPVLCSPISSLKEVCGEAALYSRTSELPHLIMKIIEDQQLTNSLEQAGERRAELFNLARLGRATFEVYQQTLGEKILEQEVLMEAAA